MGLGAWYSSFWCTVLWRRDIMQAVITCIAASTIHYSMPSEEKNILCNLQVYNPYTVSFQKKSVYSGTVIRYGFCSLWTYGKLSGSIFFIWYQNWTKKPLETGKKIWIRIPCSLVRWSSSLWSHSLFRQWLWDDTAMPHENQTPSATTLSLSISAFSSAFGIAEWYLRTWRYPDPQDYH